MSKIAKIFGYILGDGWIDKNGNCGASGDVESLKALSLDITSFFGEGTCGKIKTRRTFSPKYGIEGTTSQFYITKKVSRELQKLGMPKGRRPSQEFFIPKWILSGDHDTKASFFSGYYAAEGLIPSMQTNKRTPRCLSFCFNKNLEFLDCSREMANQFSSIVSDLGLSASILETFETTDSEKVKQTIVIGNSEQDFIKALNLLRLEYCIAKEVRRQQLLVYFSLKQNEREKIQSIINSVKIDVRENSFTYKMISEKYGLKNTQICKILEGRNKGSQVRGFPKFDQDFIEKYCLTKTPLNDETLSDFIRQTTTCQAAPGAR